MVAPVNGAARDRLGCAFCQGRGSQKTFSCTVCHGTGVVPSVRDPTQLCPGCERWAYERSRGIEGLDGRGRGAVTFVA